jgi:hypothetical protein
MRFKASPPTAVITEEAPMKRKDFLGPKTITLAAGIPPMGTVFTAFPAVVSRPSIDLPLGLPSASSLAPAPPETLKIHLKAKAPHRGCSA